MQSRTSPIGNRLQLVTTGHATGCMQLQLRLRKCVEIFGPVSVRLHPKKAKNRTGPDFRTLNVSIPLFSRTYHDDFAQMSILRALAPTTPTYTHEHSVFSSSSSWQTAQRDPTTLHCCVRGHWLIMHSKAVEPACRAQSEDEVCDSAFVY